MHFHYITYKTTLEHKNPYPGGHEIYNFVRPFLVNYFYILSLYGPSPGVEKKIFFRNTSVLHFLTQIYLPLEIVEVK